jgi:hypothetical protein
MLYNSSRRQTVAQLVNNQLHVVGLEVSLRVHVRPALHPLLCHFTIIFASTACLPSDRLPTDIYF